jgi:GTPase SAR1 family protein
LYYVTNQTQKVFNVNDEKSFSNVQNWREEFLLKAGVEDPKSFPFILIGNKIDLDERQVSKKKAQKWCEDNGGIPYFEASLHCVCLNDILYVQTSAKDGVGVTEAFINLARGVIDRESER